MPPYSTHSFSLASFPQHDYFDPFVCLYIDILFLLLLDCIPWHGYATICSSMYGVDGHWACFQVVAMINKAAVDIYTYAFIWTYAFYFLV